MRLLIACLFALALSACAHLTGVSQGDASRGEPLTAMTYNIRLDLASDGANAWPNRRDMAIALIGHEAPDVIGMQEVLLGQMNDLRAGLSGYRLVGVGRDDGGEGGEFSPIGWREDRFVLVDWGTFWLSDTPAVPGLGWDAAYPRIATWALLRDRRNGRVLRVLNTHLDNTGETARARGAALILRWAREGEGADSDTPTVIMGDFNAPPGSTPYSILTGAGSDGLLDSRTASATPPYGPGGTFNGFDIESDSGAPIDHIFVSPGIAVDGYSVMTQQWGGRLPSDHYPVKVQLRLPAR
ncbi:endonuclease/exonuclease/phosphatase family protein [Erythrobacter sp. LQ02-29]|uniref:endonuclease/exonuclease/phosphatase family protein n=1 Tax=Erythrobacter sp. LQ02-29 TaxID=2920384 RepID=UPI001F4E64EB|nr:endonuclease/exonuclease/phosphatase family protein [Erythrobacter sp. LQ02-29]MCP9221159.1 endonuclease/exonuclease/phosphatase family protein [Erythrobacter sp. LQ02-29]